MKPSYSIQDDMARVVDLVRQYITDRVEKRPIQSLNKSIRDLRIVLQQVITNHFLHLPLQQARQFRGALADQLLGVCNNIHSRCGHADEDHHHYFIKEVMVCFEWAEQIKEEIPDDAVTQMILAVDIPILRPFDYGFKKGKSLKPPNKIR